jgi:hypothetical protein
MPELAGKARLVYEFDSADLQTGYMYPAMVRAFRQGGAQLAAMFAYDMLETASRNLGWQTHRLNLVYTPRKAMSAVIAAEAMRRLPRGGAVRPYPENTTFGPFRVSYEENLSEMAASDAFLYACTTRTAPSHPEQLRRVAGCGSSPVVAYDGAGVYFLDRVRDGVWRLEVYPDAVDVADPFEMPRLDKIVTRAIYRDWPMTVRLPDLGASFSVQPIKPRPERSEGHAVHAQDGRFVVTPGVYVLSARGPLGRDELPARIGNLAFDEFHAPKPDPLPTRVLVSALPEYVTGRPVVIGARVVTDARPDSVWLWVRPLGRSWFSRYPMRPDGPYDYRATIPADTLRAGPQELMVSVRQGDSTVTFPEGVARSPWDWDFSAQTFWRTTIVGPRVPLRLLAPGEDAPRLAFTRIGDAGRQGIFGVVPSSATGEPALRLTLPVNVGGLSPDDYTASLVVKDRVAGRGESIAAATGVRVRLRGVGARQRLHVTLVEKDGTSWSAALDPDSTWQERTIPLAEFHVARGVKLPLGFPGQWNYWVDPAAGRGGAGDRIRLPDVERLQLSLRREPGLRAVPNGYGVEVESVSLVFE